MNIGPINVAYTDGRLGLNNPINVLMDEAKQLWPSRDVACIVSIGTGVPVPRDVGQTLGPLIKILKKTATDTEDTVKDFKRENKVVNTSVQGQLLPLQCPAWLGRSWIGGVEAAG